MKKPFILLTAIVMSVMLSNVSMAQESILHKLISIKGNNITVSSLLHQIQDEHDIVISYSPSQIDHTKVVSVNFRNVPLNEVIAGIIQMNNLQISQRGNHIVLSIEEPKPIETPVETHTENIPEPETRIIYHTDTLTITEYIKDTIIRVDTLVRIDTLIQMDTLLVNPYAADTIYPWQIGVSYMHMLPTYIYEGESELIDATKNLESPVLNNFGVRLDIAYSKKNLYLASGLGYLKTGNEFSHSKTTVEGGYYRQDTVDLYYTLTGTDTVWYPVLDSTWIDEHHQTFENKGKTSYTYLQIPFEIGYQNTIKRLKYKIKAGGSMLFILRHNGTIIDPEDYEDVVLMEDKYELGNNLMIHAGIDLSYPLHERLEFKFGVQGGQTLYSFYTSEYPLSKSMQYIGFDAGLIIKL